MEETISIDFEVCIRCASPEGYSVTFDMCSECCNECFELWACVRNDPGASPYYFLKSFKADTR